MVLTLLTMTTLSAKTNISAECTQVCSTHTSNPSKTADGQSLAAAAQLAEGGLLSGLLGDFCHSFHTISLYWLCFRPGFSSFSSGSVESEKAANAAFTRLVGTALV